MNETNSPTAPRMTTNITFDQNPNYVFKYVIIGDNSVGKSGLIQSLIHQENVRGIEYNHLIFYDDLLRFMFISDLISYKVIRLNQF